MNYKINKQLWLLILLRNNYRTKCKNATLLPSRKQTPGCLKRNDTIPKSNCLLVKVHKTIRGIVRNVIMEFCFTVYWNKTLIIQLD